MVVAGEGEKIKGGYFNRRRKKYCLCADGDEPVEGEGAFSEQKEQERSMQDMLSSPHFSVWASIYLSDPDSFPCSSSKWCCSSVSFHFVLLAFPGSPTRFCVKNSASYV